MADILTPDVHVSSLLHPAILLHYCPVVAASDGDCLWHSLSICLLGTQELVHTLRMITVFVMKQNKGTFMRLIRNDQIHEHGTPEEIFDRHIHIALAIISQRDVYTYSRFAMEDGSWSVPENTSTLQLVHMFRLKKNGLGCYILYRVPSHLQTDQYSTDNPCCIFYDMAQLHYTPILPLNATVCKFRPYTNLFTSR